MVDVACTLPADHVYRLVIYYDEAVPGALLRLDDRRKFWAFYCGCLEFGHRLHQYDAWVTCWDPSHLCRQGGRWDFRWSCC